MIRRDLRPLVVAALAAALVSGRGHPAAAQMAPGGFGAPGGMQPPPPGGGNQEKEEGPAEEAPEENRPADLEPLGEYAEQAKRRMQIFELDGYLRLRSDYLHNFALGQAYTNVPDGVPGVHYGLPPFPLPVECPPPVDNSAPPSPLTTARGPASRCPHDSIGGANLRFRLEPTINVTDQVRDPRPDRRDRQHDPRLDAGLAGGNSGLQRSARDQRNDGTPVSSTALPGVAPNDFLYTTQDAPEVGQNGFVSSIRAKRAWAEVDSEFGSLRFGRMPWQWGRGIVLQRRRLRGLRRRHDRRSGHGADDPLRSSVRRGLGSRRARADDPAAHARAHRSERLPVRPVAERRRAGADGVGHPPRRSGRAPRAHRSWRHGRQLRAAGGLSKSGQHARPAELAGDHHGHAERPAAAIARSAPAVDLLRCAELDPGRLAQALLQVAHRGVRGDRHLRPHRQARARWPPTGARG